MQYNAEWIERDLSLLIDASTRKIALLDGIRAREDKKAKKYEIDEIDKIDRLNSTLCLSAAFDGFNTQNLSSDIVSLMLEVKASKRERKSGRKYKPFLINTDDLLSKFELQYKISELILKKEPFHYDCIIMTWPHCSSMQIRSDGECARVLYIDAAGDQRNLPYAQSFAKYDNTLFISHEGGIQYDRISCPIFSIQHLNNLSYVPFKELDCSATIESGIMSLYPLFLKHIQSTSLLDEYYKKDIDQHVDKSRSKTLKEYIDNYSIISNITDGSTKKINYSIAYKMHKYLLASIDKLTEIKTQGLDLGKIIESRKSLHDKNSTNELIDYDIRRRMFKCIVEQGDIEKIKDLVMFAMFNRNSNPSIIDELIKSGADLNIIVPNSNYAGRKISPIEWAIQNNHIELINLLLDNVKYEDNKDILGRSFISFMNNNDYCFSGQTLDILKILQDRGVDINEQNDLGDTILHKAVKYSNPTDIATNLIGLGSTINVVNKKGKTPLHCALNVLAIKALLGAGADVNAKDIEKKTPLEIILHRYNLCIRFNSELIPDLKKRLSILIDRVTDYSFLTDKVIYSINNIIKSLSDDHDDRDLCNKLSNVISAGAPAVSLNKRYTCTPSIRGHLFAVDDRATAQQNPFVGMNP